MSTKKSTGIKSPEKRAAEQAQRSEKRALAARRPPLIEGPAVALRAAVGLVLIIIIAAILNYDYHATKTELVGKKGETLLINDRFLEATQTLRTALTQDPDHPHYQLWLADAIIRYENLKATSGQSASLNLDQLRESISLLEDSQPGVNRPSVVNLRAAQAASMIAEAGRQGTHKVDVEFFNQAAVSNFLQYREIQRFPLLDRRGFYQSAEVALHHVGNSAALLTFHDDQRYYIGFDKQEDLQNLNIVQKAYSDMGEFPQVFALVANATLHNVFSKERGIQTLKAYGSRYNQPILAENMIRELQQD